MKTTAQKQQKGFTIIEVLIVLSIAGLIMLIVFLAVPALRRSARNEERRRQASTYVAAIGEFVQSNRGSVPSTAAHVTTINELAADGPMAEPTAAVPATGTVVALVATGPQMLIVTGASCSTTVIGGSTASTTQRSFVLLYTIENSNGGVVGQCLEG